MTGRNLLHKIVSKIEDKDERDASELPLLFNSVDTEALQKLVESGVERIEFQHAGYRIVIVHGEVTVHDVTEHENKCH